MSQSNLIIAAPWDYVPTDRATAELVYRTGTPPTHVCHICGASTNVLDLGEYPIRFLGAHVWLRLDCTGEPDSTTGPALEAVKRILRVDRLEFGVFPIPW